MPENIKDKKAALEAEAKRLIEENKRLAEQESVYKDTRKAMLLMLEDLSRTSDAVTRSKHELEATFNAITDPLFVHDKQMRLVKANSAYSIYAGTQDFIGKPYYKVFPLMDKPFSLCDSLCKSNGESEGEAEEVTIPYINKTFNIRYYPIRDDSGRFIYSIHILQDITLAKVMQGRLMEEMSINASLLSIAEAAIKTKDLEKLMQHVIESVSGVLGADICLSYLKEMKGYAACQAYGLGKSDMPRFKAELLDDGLWFVKQVVDKNESLLLQAPSQKDAGAVENGLFTWLNGVSSILVIPLISRVGPVGLIFVCFKRQWHISERDRKIIKGFSNQVSSAVEEARLYRESVSKAAELSHKIETIKVMNEIDRSILSTLDSGEILEIVIRLLARVLPCDRVTVGFIDKERGGFVFQAGFGLNLDKGFFTPFESTSSTKVVETGMLQFVPDLRNEERLLPLEKMLLDSGFLSHIRVPIVVKGEVTALLTIGSKRAGVYTGEDISTLEELGFQVGVALENARLLQDLEELFISTLKSLSKAIDAKSPWTHGHSERVTLLSLRIARKMGFHERELKTLEIAGLLHDIGKIGTYEAVLDKPGKLTEEELKLMQMHPAKGAEIIEPIKQLRDMIPVIKYHHEAYDGTGYPTGLKGDDIPLVARIVTVADAVDAMGADRPYRKGRPMDLIIKELQRCSGTQFDPDVVKIFLEISHAGEIEP
ncbi:MAG: hypothetical protein A3J24_07470 [Deltaproteobacteria bacterium RIFCSPLOWO2_02_FULL_53_8]|nr:MAG: hypothetical protein A3J24_07470 [Deltaproteobacteria bacterium RIFCSPLOWO2_02_FULL_53_8]